MGIKKSLIFLLYKFIYIYTLLKYIIFLFLLYFNIFYFLLFNSVILMNNFIYIKIYILKKSHIKWRFL